MTGSREDEVRAALPELELIDDAATRDAIVRIWADLWAQSDHEQLTRAPFLEGVRRTTLIEHTRAVTQGADALARIIDDLHDVTVDRQLVVAAALLHDASKLVELDPGAGKSETGRMYPHPFLAAAAMRAEGLDDAMVNLVITHTPTLTVSGARTVEAQILEHADLVSAFILLDSEGLPLPDR